MPNWLKLLAMMTLVIVGLPAAASAHGGDFDSDGVTTSAYTAESRGTDAASETSLPAVLFFEASQSPSQTHDCTGSCCCQGMSHCSSSGGCSSSALNGNALLAFDPRVARVATFDDRILKNLDPSFGLERPPRG